MKLKIDNDALIEDFFDGTLLLGLVAPINGYRFSWQLNQILGFDFRVNNEIEIKLTKKTRDYFFSIFQYTVPSTSFVHYLYHNQDQGEYLLPEFKHLDFLWLIQGGELLTTDELNILIQSIKTLPGVQLVTEMTNEKIKNKQHLIL